jgi:DNA-binding transcriptional MocR family regulator
MPDYRPLTRRLRLLRLVELRRRGLTAADCARALGVSLGQAVRDLQMLAAGGYTVPRKRAPLSPPVREQYVRGQVLSTGYDSAAEDAERRRRVEVYAAQVARTGRLDYALALGGEELRRG